ncbi:MAG: protease inhibitor I42 family protein [Sphingobacteriales bacterium]|nr:protease inhibitor I42 family protein [Sphingobacteriales bacterium]
MKLLLFLFLFSACDTAKHPKVTPAGDTISVKINTTFTIKLSTSMGTGYSWGLTDSAWTKYMALDSVTVVNNVEGKDDGADTQIFYFRSLVKSTTTLHFIRRRPWESPEKADKERYFTIIIE